MAIEWSWYLGENKQIAPAGIDAPPAPVPDEFWQQVIKTIPVIVVSVYTAAAAVILASPDDAARKIFFAAALVIGLVATVAEFLMIRGLNWNDPDRAKKRAARGQVVVGLLAFLVWSYAQADWAVAFGIFNGVLAGLAVLGMALVIRYAKAILGRVPA